MAEWVPSILLFILAAAMIGYGVLYYRWGRQTLRVGQASMLWPTTAGRISASVVQYLSTGAVNGAQTGYYTPEVAYTYTVRELTYTGTAIAFRDLRGWQKTSADIVAKYPVGSEVAVHYDPSDPRMCVLEAGTVGIGRFFSLAAVLILLGVAIAAAGVAMPILRLYS